MLRARQLATRHGDRAVIIESRRLAHLQRDGWYSSYKVLSASRARMLIESLYAYDEAGLDALRAEFAPQIPHYADRAAVLDAFLQCFGVPESLLGDEFPQFASLLVLHCEPPRVVNEPMVNPMQAHNDAIQLAREAPRGYVLVETVDEDGAPVPWVRVEALLADGDVRTASTSEGGSARFDPIPRGTCHIRLPELDGTSWRPESGAPSQFVNAGRKCVHTVKQGEWLARIAHQYGIETWKKVWDAVENKGLREKRKNPNVLYPGDEVVIPGRAVHEIVRSTEQTHRVVIKAPGKVRLRLLLLDEKREPLANARYEVVVDGAVIAKGEITQGAVACDLPIHVSGATLLVHTGNLVLERPLKIGALDPAEEVSGGQARLANLGWYDGVLDGKSSELLTMASNDYRYNCGLEIGAGLDEELLRVLAKEHKV